MDELSYISKYWHILSDSKLVLHGLQAMKIHANLSHEYFTWHIQQPTDDVHYSLRVCDIPCKSRFVWQAIPQQLPHTLCEGKCVNLLNSGCDWWVTKRK